MGRNLEWWVACCVDLPNYTIFVQLLCLLKSPLTLPSSATAQKTGTHTDSTSLNIILETSTMQSQSLPIITTQMILRIQSDLLWMDQTLKKLKGSQIQTHSDQLTVFQMVKMGMFVPTVLHWPKRRSARERNLPIFQNAFKSHYM